MAGGWYGSPPRCALAMWGQWHEACTVGGVCTECNADLFAHGACVMAPGGRMVAGQKRSLLYVQRIPSRMVTFRPCILRIHVGLLGMHSNHRDCVWTVRGLRVDTGGLGVNVDDRRGGLHVPCDESLTTANLDGIARESWSAMTLSHDSGLCPTEHSARHPLVPVAAALRGPRQGLFRGLVVRGIAADYT